MDVRFGPNIVNYVPMGVTVTPVVPPLPSGPIQQTIAMLQSSIERGTFGSVIRGDKPPQTTSAAQLSILSGQARLRFGSIKIHLEAMMESANKKIGVIQQNVLRSPLTLFQTDEKMMRDMLAMRRQQRMQEALFSPQGGANQQGSLPGMRDLAPQGLGGRPEQMTSEQANQDAQATFNA
jgi:hypothetical protein